MEFYDGFDEDYLDRLRAGDYRTQQHFCAYFGKLLQIKLKHRLRSHQDIEDAKQTVFVRFFDALRKENGIRDAKCVASYLISTCRNVLLEMYRKRTTVQLEEPVANAIPDPAKSAVDIVGAQETKKMVQETLNELGERDRRILRELFLEEREKDEICRDYKVTRGYLRVLILRAKDKFRQKMRNSPPGGRSGPKPKGGPEDHPPKQPKSGPKGKPRNGRNAQDEARPGKTAEHEPRTGPGGQAAD